MVTHTRNSCSAFNPSKSTHTKVNTHTHRSEHAHTQKWTRTHTHTHHEHTPGAVGRHLCYGVRGAVGGSVPCSRASQSRYWGWRECCTFTPPTYNSCWTETRTHKRSIMSPTLYHLATTFPQRQLQWSIKKDMSMPDTLRLVIHGKRTTGFEICVF